MIPENSEEVYSFPLSFSQQRLWFLDQISPGNPFYNIALTIPLKAPCRLDLLEGSLNHIIERHEILRTNFIVNDGDPLQIVHAKRSLVVNCREHNLNKDSDRDQIIAMEYSKAITCCFDLKKDLLLNATLLKFGEQDYFFILVMHHIISDGWSLRILWDELTKIYNALIIERPVPLDPIIIQYGDYTIWQREWLNTKVLDEQLDYWKSQLEDVPTLRLSTDKARPSVLTYKGAFENIKISRSLSSALRSISQQEGATMFMTLLTAYVILLHRCTMQKSIAIGSPFAGRNRVELEGLIGFFVNTLVIKIDIDPGQSFISLLQRTKQTVMDALAHQDLPFEKLVEELHLERDLSRNPLFQVSFQLLTSPNSEQQKNHANRDKSYLKLEKGIAIFDIALNLVDTGDEVEGHFEFSTDLFFQETMERMAVNYKSLLMEIVAQPQKKIKDMTSVSKKELEQTLGWNNTQIDFSANSCVHNAIEQTAEQFPDHVAVYSERESLNYSELNQKANRLAHYLSHRGIGQESLVGVCMDRSADMIVAWFAILKVGAAYIPIDPSYPFDRIKYIADHTKIPLLITNKKYGNKLKPLTKTTLLFFDETNPELDLEQITNLGISVNKQNRAYLIFTSGTTGAPKGVEITHRGLINLCHWHIHQYTVTASDKATQLANPAFDASTWEIWPYLIAGAAIFIIDEETRMSAHKLAETLIKQQINICFAPTPIVQALFEEPGISGVKLRALLTGGDWLKQYPLSGLGFELFNHYGPTENSVVATCGAIHAKADTFESFPSIGKPISNVKLHILNENFQPVPIGAIGELYIAGDGLARCYFNAPALTALSFLPNPFSDSGERIYRTGDWARYLSDGNIEFHGRRDNQVKLRGFRIELQEIESKILQFDRIKECVVLLVANESGNEQLAAFIIADPDKINNTDGLKAYLLSKLPQYMVPDHFIFIDTFPLTSNGKIDKTALKKFSLSGSHQLIPPKTPLEQVIGAVWEEILHRDQIGTNQNFFTELGGHSLLATQLVSRLRAVFSIDIPLQKIFEAPTILEFSLIITEDPLERMKIERIAELLLSMNEEETEDLLKTHSDF